MKEFIITEDLVKLLEAALGSAKVKNVAHVLNMSQLVGALNNLKPVEAAKEEKAA